MRMMFLLIIVKPKRLFMSQCKYSFEIDKFCPAESLLCRKGSLRKA